MIDKVNLVERLEDNIKKIFSRPHQKYMENVRKKIQINS